jgi:hypothetical protein
VTSVRKSALVAGVLYLVTFIAGIPPSFLYEPLFANPQYVLGQGPEAQVALGAFLDMVTGLAGIGTALALYSIVRRQHEGFALGFVTTRVVEAASIMVGAIGLLTIATLRQAGTAGTDAASMSAIGQALVAIRDWTHLFGPGLMPVLNAVLIGTLMYRSRLIPRIIPALGLIGAPILLSSSLGTMFGVNHTMSLWTGLATMPIFFWELAFGLWMTFRGFSESAPILAGYREDAASPSSSAARFPAQSPAVTSAGQA